MSYLEMENSFRIKANDVRYCYQTGLIYASCFGYSEMTKALIRSVNKKGSVFVDRHTVDKPANSYDTFSCKISGTDYYHTIVMRRDKIDKDENGNEYIFCVICVKADSHDDAEKLFAERLYDKISQLSSVPMSKDWSTYLYRKIRQANGVVFTTQQNFVTDNRPTRQIHVKAFKIFNSWLINVFKEGLSSGCISIDNCSEISPAMQSIDGLDSYLTKYNEILTQKIQQSFVPRFTPQQDTYSQTLLDLKDYSSYMGKLDYFPAQMSVVQAVSNTLDVQRSAFICGEMGCGIFNAVLGQGR